MTFETRRIRLATGLNLNVLEWGRSAPEREHTVILVHGFLDLAWSWVRSIEAGLAEDFHVVAADMRGHGDSDRVGAGGYYHFMDYIADVASLVEEVGRARVSLVGHSMGGSIVAYYAGSHPERVHRLALLEGYGPPEDDADLTERIAAWIKSWKRALAAEPRVYPDLAAAAERLCANDSLLDPALAREIAEHGTLAVTGGVKFKHDPVHLTRGPYPFRLETAKSFWRRITCPVLLVEGSESHYRALPDLDERVGTFANARRVVLEGAGHMLQRHRPRELGALLCEFLA